MFYNCIKNNPKHLGETLPFLFIYINFCDVKLDKKITNSINLHL